MKLERKIYETRQEKLIDFAIGFVGCIVIGITLASFVNFIGDWLYQTTLPAGTVQDCINAVVLGLAMANLCGLIGYTFIRKWIAVGAATAIGIALLLGAFFVYMFFTNFP